MKRAFALLLIAALLMGVALADVLSDISTYVERQGFKAASIRNKSGLVGCWFVEGTDTDTLQWSDKSRVYTVSSNADSELRGLYGELIGMYEWDTCTYSVGDRVQFAYNAPEITASRTYKTLKNYVRYVGEYIESLPPVVAPSKKAGRQTYVINKDSRIFHYKDCQSAQLIKKDNREQYTGYRSDLIAQGYHPCKRCNP